MKRFFWLLIFVITITQPAFPNKTRIILTTDNKQDYYEFWPLVAKQWKLWGYEPTLFFVGDKLNPFIKKHDNLGDVYCFPTIKGIDTGVTARVVRLFLGALFPDDVCILADIDLCPLKKSIFSEVIAQNLQENAVLTTCTVHFRPPLGTRDQMCYLSAYGRTFAKLFDVYNLQDIRKKFCYLQEQINLNRDTDEAYFRETISASNEIKRIRLNCYHYLDDRLIYKSVNWGKLANGSYADFHMPRPYSAHRNFIDRVVMVNNAYYNY